MNQIGFLNLEYVFNLVFRFFGASKNLTSAVYQGLPPVDVFQIFLLSFSVLVLTMLAILGYKLSNLIQTNKQEADDKFSREKVNLHNKTFWQKRWEGIIAKLETMSDSSWAVAVMEADKMLDDILADAGYSGATIGDKLKSLGSSKIEFVQDAWDAHKIRNQIAHEGEYILTDREAKRALLLYKSVFANLGYL